MIDFRNRKNVDYQFSAKQSMQGSLDIVIYRFLCTPTKLTMFNHRSSITHVLFGRPLALKVIRPPFLVNLHTRGVRYLCDGQGVNHY